MRDTVQDKIQSFAFIIAVGLCIFPGVYFAGSAFSDSAQGSKIELDSRINPNTASLASLVRLPGVGIGRAGAIVAYRENYFEKNNEDLAFKTIDDLRKVKGIGPKTAKNVSRWLKFQ